MKKHQGLHLPTTTGVGLCPPECPDRVRRSLAGIFDSVHFSQKNGEWTARRGYYYTNGMNCEKLENAVRRACSYAVILKSEDHRNTWPSGSFFTVTFRFPEFNEGEI
jgi:hypothetical protein